MRKTIILTVILCLCSQLFAIDYVTHRNTGTKVWIKTKDKMFPESWLDNEINAQAESLKLAEFRRSITIVFNALDKYPIEFIKKNLKEVYVLHFISFYGVEYGGTNSSDVVYITNQGVTKGYTDEYIEQLFHAEFSSIVLRNYASIDYNKDWCSINNKEFRYGDGGVAEIKTGKAGLDYAQDYFKNGFLYEYAMSGSENDFNSIAKNLFCPSKDFWSLYGTYIKLSKKINLAIELYHSADSSFNLIYFRNLNQ
jgi:hypothetical protein